MNASKAIRAPDSRHLEWIPLLDTATREVFELMLGSHLTVPDTLTVEKYDYTSMVGLAGQLCGVLNVRCDAKAAALIAARMLGLELDKVGPEISDALGEVANMIAGNFKNKVTGLAEGCMLSPPTVVTGSDYSMHSLTEAPSLDVRLLFEGMPVVVSLEIHT